MDNGERYISVEQSLIDSIKQMKEMQAGRLPKKTWAEARAEIEAEIAAEKAQEERSNNERKFNSTLRR